MGYSQSHAEGTLASLLGTPDDGPIEGELFVRSLAPFATYRTQERLIDRLRRLRNLGALESLSIRVWGDAVRTGGAVAVAGDEETVADRITEMIGHAATTSWSISRYFHVATDEWMTAGGRTDGGVTDDGARVADGADRSDVDDGPTDGVRGRRIVPPRRCLSLREDGELLAVFPCDVADERYTPEDALAYLESVERDLVSNRAE